MAAECLVFRSAAIAGALSLLAAPAAPAQSMFRGAPAHLGVYDSPTAPTLSTLAWKFKTGGRVISSPALAGETAVFGSADRNVYAVNTTDGSLRWKFTTDGLVTASPAIEGGTVYVNSADGRLYALDLASGAVKWRFATRGERRFTAPGIHGISPRAEMMPDPFDMFTSSPVVADGRVYFGSGDGNIYAVDAASGRLSWSFQTGNVVHATPAVVDGVVYVGSWDRNLYALDATTGARRWVFETGQDTVIYNQVGIVSSAAVANGTVYFGARDGHFYAVDAASGVLRWKHDNHMGWVIASPAVLGNTVYFPTSDGTRFKALDASTGSVRFDIGNKAVSFSSPAIAAGTVYYGTSDGVLHAIDATTGRVVAEFQTDGHKANARKYTDAEGKMSGALLYPDRTLDGIFIGLDRMFSMGSIISSPVVRNGVVYVGSADGALYALR